MRPTRGAARMLVTILLLALASLFAGSWPRASTAIAPSSNHHVERESVTHYAWDSLTVPPYAPDWLDLDHPLALADSSLPRLSSLSARQRAGIAMALLHQDITTRVACYAFLQVGTPYELGPLGEGAPPDSQPVLEFKTTDCTTINLVSAALAHAAEPGGEQRAMALANYRDGVVSYATRFHFTTDRLDSSPYFRDITRRVGGAACRHQRLTLNRRADGSHWIPIDWTRRREVFYIPRERGAMFERWFDNHRIPAAMGIAFVQSAKLSDGLDVVHESMLWQGRTLLHASSLSGRVITLPWQQFLENSGARYDGFVLFEYR